MASAAEPCSWCGEKVEPDAGFRACEPESDKRAVFCRLEHVVPWAMRGAHWRAALWPGEAREVVETGTECRLLIAVRVGTTRLIDNVGVSV